MHYRQVVFNYSLLIRAGHRKVVQAQVHYSRWLCHGWNCLPEKYAFQQNLTQARISWPSFVSDLVLLATFNLVGQKRYEDCFFIILFKKDKFHHFGLYPVLKKYFRKVSSLYLSLIVKIFLYKTNQIYKVILKTETQKKILV